ncbi:uncharacterized protein, partial [Diadema antillarum]|uniref:uncharacterized protein n=1 Tax=Diadema antillarum TaxID=105358 RepID=UPI003A8B5367
MARPVSRQLSGVFYMLNCDLHKEVLQDFSTSHSRKVAGPAVTWREFPKGTLLERVLEAPLYGRIVKDGTYIMRSLDDENGEFACSSSYVSPLSRKEMNLLQALSKRQERYEIYWYFKDLLRFAQTVQIGTQVFVKLKIQNMPEDVAGTVRYVGELPDQQGIQFGVELEECRGYGTTDGVFRHQRLFHCDQDCGVFVKMNRLRQRYNPPKPEKREAPPSPAGIYIGQRVSIFIEEQDQRQGEVIYYGKPKTANEEYVGIHLDSTCKEHERNNGVYKNREKLFTPRDVTHTILLPAFSVYPTGCLEDDHTVPAELEDSFEDLSDYDIGDYVTIFTQEGEKEGVVLWKGVPMEGREPYVGIELSKQCEQFSDGTYRGNRLFFPKNPDRTILVPASSVVKALTPDTVKDSLEPHPENLYKEVRVSEKPSAPRQIPRPPPDKVPVQTLHSWSRDHSDELKPGFVTPISEPKRPASGLPSEYESGETSSMFFFLCVCVTCSVFDVMIPTGKFFGNPVWKISAILF